MAAIQNDANAGRWLSVSHKLTAIANRSMRVLGIGDQHPAARTMVGRTQTVAGPTAELFNERFRRGTSSVVDRIRENLSTGRSPIGPAPAPRISPGAYLPTVAPPDLNKAIRDRKEKKS